MQALIFDCDGVLVDTERDGHRVAFNRAFKALGLDVEWDVPLYGELLLVGGGKERMRHYFDTYGWPEAMMSVKKSVLVLCRAAISSSFDSGRPSGQPCLSK